jgi:DNA anti-recombination protein RmuC
MMGSESKDNINLTELLLKISSDVSAIKTDMQNFKDSYKNEKENLLTKIDDVRKDFDKEIKTMKETFEEKLKQQDAQIKLLTTYTEALRTQKDKEDAKKWRVVIGFILTGIGGILLGCIPAFLKYLVQTGVAQ